MKKNAIKLTVFAVIIAMVFAMTMVIAVTTTGNGVADAATNTTVKLTAPTSVVPGSTFTLEVEITSTRPGVWYSWGITISPLKDGAVDTSLLSYLSIESKTLNVTGYKDTTAWNSSAGISISGASETSTRTPVTTPIKHTIVVRVASGASGPITLGFRTIRGNNVKTMDGSTTNIDDGRSTGGLAGNSVEIAVRAASSVNTLSGLSVGHAGGTLTPISTDNNLVPNAVSYVSESSTLNNFVVQPTATDATATIRVGTGSAANVAQNGTVVKSGERSGNIDLGTTNTPNGTLTAYITVTPENGGAYSTYTITVRSNYIALSSLTSQSNTGATNPTKDGVEGTTINVPSDATQITLTGRYAGGYGIQSTVSVTGTGCTPASSSLTLTNNNTTFTVNVSNLHDGDKVKITGTSSNGKELASEYTIKMYSVDAELSTLNLNAGGQTIAYDDNQTDTSRDYYYFSLPTGVNDAAMNLANGNGATIRVGSAAYNASQTYGVGTYTVTVTAAAGNVRTYTIVIAKQVQSASLEELEMSFNRVVWTNVLTEPEYNSGSGLYSKTWSTSDVSVNSFVYFRYTATEGATVTTGSSVSVVDSTTYSGQLAIGSNEFRFTASSSAGNMIYTLRLSLSEGVNTISGASITSGGNAISGFTFNKDQTSYNLNVPYSVGTLRLAITIDGQYAVVKTARDGQMERDEINPRMFITNRELSVGSNNTITFFAVADNGNGAEGTHYTITVTRAQADTNNLLESLSITVGTETAPRALSPAFSSEVLNYFITNDTNFNTVTITAKAQSSVASVRGAGLIDLSTVGATQDNVKVLTIVVTSESGLERSYRISISSGAMNFNNNFEIVGMRVVGSDSTNHISFTGSTYEYNINVPFAVSWAFITATTLSSSASVHMLAGVNETPVNPTDRQDLEVGLNKFIVYAVAEDSTNADRGVQYVINITRAQANSNAFLSTIIINNVPLANFDKNVFEYISTQESTVSNANLFVEAEESGASLAISANGETTSYTGLGTRTIPLNEAGRSVTVTISVTIDGSTTVYTLRISRASVLPVLSYLSIGSYDFTDIDGNVIDMNGPTVFLDYNTFFTAIEYNVASLEIIAETSSPANIRINGRGASDNGNGGRGVVFDIVDLFGNGMSANVRIDIIPTTATAVNTYILTIVRKPDTSSNTDAEITIPGHIAGADDFNDEYSNKTNFFGVYTIDFDNATLPFEVEFPDLGEHVAPAEYEIYYNTILKNRNGEDVSNVKLNIGTNIISININASDNATKRTISIIVVRDEFKFDRADIDEIGAFNREYRSNRDNYSYSVENDIKKLNFKLETSDEYEYRIDGDNLATGMNTVIISVYEKGDGTRAGDTLVKTISINVYREAKNSATAWMVVGIVFLVLCIVVTALLVLLIFKNSKNGGNGGQPVMQPVIIQTSGDATTEIQDEKARKKAEKEQKKIEKAEQRMQKQAEKAKQKAEMQAAKEEAAAIAAANALAAKEAAEKEAAAKEAASKQAVAEPDVTAAGGNEFIVSTGKNNGKKVKIRLNISGMDGTDITNMTVENPDDKK